MKKPAPVTGTLLDEDVVYDLTTLCQLCDVGDEVIVEMIAEGLIQAGGAAPAEWRFNGVAVVRIQTALRLQRDLGINMPGAALALDLLDELRELRHALNRVHRRSATNQT